MRSNFTNPRVFIYFIYRLLGVLAFPLIVLYMLRRGLRDRRYWQRLGERFGAQPPTWDATVPGGIWLHAVSVGEVISSIELLRRLRAEFPAQRLYVSVTTVAGREIAEAKLKDLADAIFYAPLDFVWIVRAVLRRLRPRIVVVMETEIWPNLYREAKRFGCGLVILNGRISDRTFPRYRQFTWFLRPVLSLPDAILVQTETSLERYLELGAPAARTRNNGNLKYDFRAEGLACPGPVRALLDATRPAPVWIAASTMPPAQDGDPDEDDVVIDAFQRLSPALPRLLLMLVPRRPERFDEAARKLEAAGIAFVRRSQMTAQSTLSLPGVLLVDTMGELTSLFQTADVVFMGGTIPHRGGHNILEPAFFAKPVITGPHMENFPDIAEEFCRHGAMVGIATGDDLPHVVRKLWEDAAQRFETGTRARRLAEARRGATARAVATIREVYGRSLPIVIPALWQRIVLGPLSLLWGAGVAFDRRRKRVFANHLPAPIISIGGIAMGGVGKTPFVAWLAEQLHRQGLRTAVLTRGYKRDTPEKNVVLLPGEQCPVARTGDEAQILLRRGHAALGIGGDRYETGMLLAGRHNPHVFLLDDGFQHWLLDRDIDIVMLDGLDPFARDALFPLGRLRERRGALRRASAIVVSRATPPIPWTALEKRIRHYHRVAPIFYCTLEPVAWVAVDGSEQHPSAKPPSKDVAAFCGLGNPAAFWATLAALDIHPRFRWPFDDHTSYLARHLKRLAEQARSTGAKVLLTTEKDAMNLPANAADLVAPLRIFWLRAGIRLDRETEFLEWLADTLKIGTR
ncbi:MAG: tetraacyldisaccharide 4'-kinase [Acidobacteria bacterium]|nr:tetraacyldisaccharide 4'-kinase [Acidobacteriota bacterium]